VYLAAEEEAKKKGTGKKAEDEDAAEDDELERADDEDVSLNDGGCDKPADRLKLATFSERG